MPKVCEKCNGYADTTIKYNQCICESGSPRTLTSREIYERGYLDGLSAVSVIIDEFKEQYLASRKKE